MMCTQSQEGAGTSDPFSEIILESNQSYSDFHDTPTLPLLLSRSGAPCPYQYQTSTEAAISSTPRTLGL